MSLSKESTKLLKKKESEEQNLSLKNAVIVHEGNQIILPIINGQPLAIEEAILWLHRKREEEEQEFNVHYEIPCSPMDGAVAFKNAIAHKYGWSQGVPTPGFFGDRPPQMLGVAVSATEQMDVPWGRIIVPGIEGYLTTGMDSDPFPRFVIGGVVKKKHSHLVNELADLTRKFVRERSIYKGKAIRVSFDWMRNKDRDGNNKYDPMQNAPQFLELGGIKEDDLIFGDEVMAALNIGLFTPIEHTAACRQHKVPLKRGILLHGPYGTGKTMTAYVAALKASKNDWTFIYLSDVTDLKQGLAFAAQYAPAVIFSEDIDRAVNGDRSVDMDAILNTLDGVDTKGAEIITVLTTNHLENINPAMLRPGRLDTLVEVSPPTAEAAARLVKLYARDLLEDGVDLNRVGEALAGFIPAIIREVTERSKIAAISRVGSADIAGKVLEEDLLAAAHAMKNHASMLAPKDAEPLQSHEIYVVPKSAETASATRVLKKQAAR